MVTDLQLKIFKVTGGQFTQYMMKGFIIKYWPADFSGTMWRLLLEKSLAIIFSYIGIDAEFQLSEHYQLDQYNSPSNLKSA